MSLTRRDVLAAAGMLIFSGVPAARAFGAADGLYGLIGAMTAAPGRRDELVAILLEGVSGMPGCLSYVVATDPSASDGLWITEVWDSAASHQASLTLPSVRAAIAKGRPLIAAFGTSTVTAPVGGHGLQPAPGAGAPAADFVNRVWQVAESTAVAPGQLYVFLSDGTLVITAPTGSPALGTWRRTGGELTMVEEGQPQRTEILALTETSFSIRSHNPGPPVDIRFVRADATAATALSAGAAPQPPAAIVSGTVTYRERMALPKDATLDVWIIDTSPGSAPLAVVAEVSLPAQGRQVPLPFDLRVDPGRVQHQRNYGLKAAIRAGGQTLFANDAAVPVITRGHPSLVALTLTRVPATPPRPR